MTQEQTTVSGAGAGSVKTVQRATMNELLCDVPLHSRCRISDLFSDPVFGKVVLPDEIRVHCGNQNCGGVRRHTKNETTRLKDGDNFFVLASYQCINCRSAVKIFGLKAEREEEGDDGFCTKIYQEPAFGQPIPKRLFEIIGEDNRAPFLQARRAIARGLGIGAYAYYRRIVENTKFTLVGSVLNVAKATNAPTGQIELLQKAQSERQFSKAIETLRDVGAIPAALLIDGHNPLALLHDLLSEGIHELDDNECLKRAQEAEVILCEIADRMQTALTERKTVKSALTSILNRKAKKDALTKTSGA
jgi:hypothetical protein